MPGSRKFPPLQRCFCDSSSLPHSTLHCTGPCTYHIGIYHCQIFQDIETSPSYWVKLLVRRISIMESHDTKVEEEQNYNRLNSMQDYFLPYSSFRIKWDALLLGLITYTCVFTPLQTSMIDMIPERNENLLSILRVLDFAIDVIFGFDFILSFNFAYFDEVEGAKTLTRERSATFLHYLKTPRCLLSLVSLVPLVVDILIYGNIHYQKLSKKHLKILKFYN